MPRIWEGIDFLAWAGLLIRNRFAVQPRYWYIAAIISVVSLFHTALRWLQELWYGHAIARTPIRDTPLFIIGHWRTGTTLLHELLILDERHCFPNYYECMEPNHFLLTEKLVTRWLHFLMPSRRPMDNMKAGWDRPQEDEFALCMMGVPSPYLTIAFPNRPPAYPEYLDFRGVPQRARESWKQAFVTLVRRLNYKYRKRLILKSPPHSGRIETLLEIFPDAKFVHIVRDPYAVYPSTVNLWKSLFRTHGLQTPTFAGLEEFVYDNYLRLYDALERGRPLIDPAHYYEVRYEDLVRDPIAQMRQLYEHLGLGGFDAALPRLRDYLASVSGYETNRYQLAPEQRAEVARRWGAVFVRYGYPT